MDKVSVIIPAYNCADTIQTCLESLRRQSYENLEVLVVDDGSKDDLSSVISQFKNITLIKKMNGGVASARNAGLDVASGDFVMFVDSDDYLDDGCIAALMQAVKQSPADIVRFRFLWEYPDGTKMVDTNEAPAGGLFSKKDFPQAVYGQMLTGIRFNSVWRQLFFKRVVEDIRFRTDVQTVEDAMFNADAYTNAQSMLLVDGVYYHYCQTGTGLTGSALSVLEKYRCNLRFSKYLLAHLPAWGMNTMKNRLKAVFRLAIITARKLRYINKAKKHTF